MTRTITAALTLSLMAWNASAVLAQSSGKVPVTQDLRRADQVERRIDAVRPDAAESRAPGAVPLDRNVTPTNPSGVAGFDGPPGTVGDSVNSFGSLPQGAAGGDIR